MHDNSQLIFQKHATSYFRPGIRVLEIGPCSIPTIYQRLVNIPSIEWETIDIQRDYHNLPSLSDLTYVANSDYDFPVSSNTFDIVLSGQVIEHVRIIWKWMRELARVCKPGGVIITIGPVNYEYHPMPYDCWRIHPEGMRALYEDSGLITELAVSESLDPGNPGKQKWFYAKWTLRALLGRSIPRPPVHFKLNAVVDTISVARKP